MEGQAEGWLDRQDGRRRTRTRWPATPNRGFLDLDERLVDALRAAGLGWGGDYAGAAEDFMHFEVK